MKCRNCELGQAAVGAAFGEVIRVAIYGCLHLLKRTYYFKSYLDGLQSTLSKLREVEIDLKSRGRLSETDEDRFGQLKDKAESLLDKCSRLKWWKQIGRCYYANQLRKLDDELIAFFQRETMAGSTRDLFEVLQLVREIQKRVVTNPNGTDSESGGDDKKSKGGGSSNGDGDHADAGLHE